MHPRCVQLVAPAHPASAQIYAKHKGSGSKSPGSSGGSFLKRFTKHQSGGAADSNGTGRKGALPTSNSTSSTSLAQIAQQPLSPRAPRCFDVLLEKSIHCWLLMRLE